MATPESKVKAKCTDLLKAVGVYYFFPVANGMGRAGIPDIICCARGRFLAIECKAGTNKPTPLQQAEMGKIKQAQGFVLVVNEDNIDDVTTLLRDIA